MSGCSTTVLLLAGLGLSYVLASVVYLVATRKMGTPFNDSLSPQQIQLKKTSAHKRRTVFWVSFGGSFLAVLTAYFMWLKSQ